MQEIKSFNSFLLEESYNLNKMYAEFNHSLFDGELPNNVPVSFKNLMKGSIGHCTCSSLRGELVPDTIKIFIDSKRVFTLEKIQGILVHEMIHAWFYINNDFKESHGWKFLKKLKEIQAKTPFKISVTHSSDDPESELVNVKEKQVDCLVISLGGKASFQLYKLGTLNKENVKLFAKWSEYDYIEYGTISTKLYLTIPVSNKFDPRKFRGFVSKNNDLQNFKPTFRFTKD